MKKIPTLFVRNPEDRRYVLPDVTLGCEWVLAGEGQATRKYDGTCVMHDGRNWWARREVKPGKEPPARWQQVDEDATTGKRVGWEPAEQSPFAKYLFDSVRCGPLRLDGTYELVGPKINGNPEALERHQLVLHGVYPLDVPDLTFDGIRTAVLSADFEGIVWHHPDGRMAKIKRRDFPT